MPSRLFIFFSALWLALTGVGCRWAQRAPDLARESAATLEAARPTLEAAAATTAVQARAIATRAAVGGADAIATIRAFGTPAVSLRDRLAQLRPDADGRLTIRVTEAELTAALAWDAPGRDDRLQNVHARITGGEIILRGDVTSPVQATAQISFAPYLDDGRLQLRITSGSLGNIALPADVWTAAENRVNRTLIAAVQAVPGEIIFTQVTAENGVLVLLGYRPR